VRSRATIATALAYLSPEEQVELDQLLVLDDVTVAVPGSFGAWLKGARPEFDWTAPHFRMMQAALDHVTAGEWRRILYQVAIRHGKTEHNTVSYGAYRLERNPKTRILIGSYNQQQADKLSRELRRLARRRGVVMSEDRDAAREWDTAAGGGVRAVGAGAGVASVNADLISIDDPIGSRDEAESAAHRDRVWDWITNDILARCDPHTAVLFTMSRWHQDDPAGRLQDRQRDRWQIIDLPGRAEPDDPLGRPVGAPLWPAMRPAAWLDEKRVELGEYGFASLVQGRPRPREGGMFKWEWWQLLDAVPAVGPMVRYWDLAGTMPKGDGHDPDYTAGALLCRMPDQRTAIVDVARFRKSIAARDAELEAICAADLAAYRGRVTWWVETEAGIAGADRTAILVRRLQALGMPVYTEHPTGKKELRAEPLASKAEAGNIVLCPGAWRDPFRAEAADFPRGRHDDQIDAAAGADAKVSPVREVKVRTFRI
jgi:predicted phage terminase large subunit-like protein